MTGTEYQYLAMRTDDDMATCRLLDWERTQGHKDFYSGGILNGCLGLAGETGELLDMVKKWIFHEKPLDESHAQKELGDVLWYCALIATSFGWELDEVMEQNIAKLETRYPEGFDIDRANNRKEDDV